MQSKHSDWFVAGAVLFIGGACHVTYEVAPAVDAGAEPDARGSDTASPSKAPLPTVMTTRLNFPCEKWGKGSPLQGGPTSAKAALGTLVSRLWTDDSASLEAAQIYLPELASATTGDVYCVALSMLQDKVRAINGVGAFYDQWLGLSNITAKSKQYPTFDSAKLLTMAKDARSFAAKLTLADTDATFASLFVAEPPLTFSPDSASLRLDDPWVSMNFRGIGLLALPGVLSALSGAESSISSRGQRMRQTFLCNGVPPDVAGGSTSPIPSKGVSYRQAHQSVVQKITCSGCHDLIDGFGYVMDAFDAVGQIHIADRFGFKFDLAAKSVFESGVPFEFNSPSALAKSFANAVETRTCYLRNWTNYVNKEIQPTPEIDEILLQKVVAAHGPTDRLDELIAAAFELAFTPKTP